ncbi:hypothetical protein V9T40_005368 [Parthenolecanium corni]|uniref:Uncharacterized protein n=1 Tax=Parthenolecanium corni TaxID=536013 RepID=A0AAN9TIM0_9HEMI
MFAKRLPETIEKSSGRSAKLLLYLPPPLIGMALSPALCGCLAHKVKRMTGRRSNRGDKKGVTIGTPIRYRHSNEKCPKSTPTTKHLLSFVAFLERYEKAPTYPLGSNIF